VAPLALPWSAPKLQRRCWRKPRTGRRSDKRPRSKSRVATSHAMTHATSQPQRAARHPTGEPQDSSAKNVATMRMATRPAAKLAANGQPTQASRQSPAAEEAGTFGVQGQIGIKKKTATARFFISDKSLERPAHSLSLGFQPALADQVRLLLLSCALP